MVNRRKTWALVVGLFATLGLGSPALAQTAGILMGEGGDRIPLLMGIDKARFRRQVVPGDRLRLEVEMVQSRRNICKVNGRAYVGEELAAEAGIMAMMVPREAE